MYENDVLQPYGIVVALLIWYKILTLISSLLGVCIGIAKVVYKAARDTICKNVSTDMQKHI